MLRKLSLIPVLIIIFVSFSWAADVSVDTAAVSPHPVPIGGPAIVGAAVSNRGDTDVSGVPIYGRIDYLLSLDTLLAIEDFEGDFPPTDWTLTVTNDSFPWVKDDLDGELYHNDLYGAYVYPDSLASDEWLITPDIDLSGYDEWDIISLGFSAAFAPKEEGVGPKYLVCVSTDGGTTWSDTLVDLIHDNFDPDSPDPEEWIYIDDDLNPFEFDLTPFVGDTITIGFNYYAQAHADNELQTLDDVVLTALDYSGAVWEATGRIDVIPVGLQQNYAFIDDPWEPEDPGYYRLSVWVELDGDEDPSNDMFVDDDVLVGDSEDEADFELLEIIRPADTETPNESFIPTCVAVNNADHDIHGVEIRCRISKDGLAEYEKSIITTLPPDTSLVDSFDAFLVGDVGTEYIAHFAIIYSVDPDTSNNWKMKTFKAGYPHSIVPVEALEPQPGHAYTELTPSAIYENRGTYGEEDWYAVATIESSAGSPWSDTVHSTTILNVGERTTITFDTFFPGDGVDYTCVFSTYINVEDFGTEDLEVGFKGGTTGVEEDGIMPIEYALGISNSVLSRDVTVNFAMPKPGHMTLRLYDVSGKLVETFVNGPTPAGYGNLSWDADGVPAGLYFLRMCTDSGFSATRKLVLVQ